MEREDNWNTMATLASAKDQIGTHLLLSLDSEKAEIKGSLSPNKEDESVKLKAQITSSGDATGKQQLTLEGNITDKSTNIKMFDSSHNFLEELSCDQNSCKRKAADGKVLSTSDKSQEYKENVSDKSLNADIEFNEHNIFWQKAGNVTNENKETVGSASVRSHADFSNILDVFTKNIPSLESNRMFYQNGEYTNSENKENRSLNLTYTQNPKDEVSFEGNFERKRTAR